MKMNVLKMRQAGQICHKKMAFTDEELDLAIEGTRFSIAYLTGSHDAKALLSVLRLRLNQLEEYREARK